ncbi:hypothetical protein D3C75_644570 [compost metagenome]
MPGQQFAFEKHTAAGQGLGQALGVAQLLDIRQAGEQPGSSATQFNGCLVRGRKVLQELEQAVQRALAALLVDQLPGHGQLFLAAAQWHEFHGLGVLHLRAQQGADAQGLRTVDAQGAAAQRGIEQAHHRAKHQGLAGHLRQHLRGQHLALQQGANGQLRGVEAGEGGDVRSNGLLHRHGQAAGRGLGDDQRGALGQRLIAGGLDRGLAAAVEGDLEQHLESLVRLLERQHFGLGGLTDADQPFHRRQQLEQLTADHLRARSRREGLR